MLQQKHSTFDVAHSENSRELAAWHSSAREAGGILPIHDKSEHLRVIRYYPIAALRQK